MFSLLFSFSTKWYSLKKLWKTLVISSKKLSSFSRYLMFYISLFPTFSSCPTFLEKMIEDKSSNYLQKNLKTHVVWYIEKRSGSDIENWLTDRVLNNEHVYRKSIRKCPQKLVPDPILILVNSPKQPMYAGNTFENKIFWKRIIKNFFESLTLFFPLHPVPFCGQNYDKRAWNYFQSLFGLLNIPFSWFLTWAILIISYKVVSELFQKLHLLIYGSQFRITPVIIQS